MDNPQYQVPQKSPSYRYMAYPFEKQRLQLLYPGRLMEPQYHYTGDNIPNEDPEGLMLSRYQNEALDIASKMEREAMNRHLGGTSKVTYHPAVEPEATIEDPRLIGLSINLDPSANVNTQNVPSELDHLGRTFDVDRNIVDDVRSSFPPRVTDRNPPSNILPRYNWTNTGPGAQGRRVIEGFTPDVGLRTTRSRPPPPSTNKTHNSESVMKWVIPSVIGILVVLFIALLVYGYHTHKVHVTQMSYLQPQYLGPAMKAGQ